MEDGFGRNIDYLRLSVTDLCNFRCRYCMPPQGVEKRPHGDILSVEECVEIGAAAASLGVKKIRLTGGEPLVRQGILDICRGLRDLEGLEELCLTTNGSLLPQFAADLRASGVDRLNISLDTLDPQRFREMTRLGSLDQVLAGIQAADDAGFQNLKLDTVLIGGFNDDEVADFISLTMEHPWELRFIELMPMGECADWDRSCFLSGESILSSFSALQEISSDGVARRFRLPGAKGTVGLICPMSRAFCSRCSRIRVTADGKLKGCLHSAEEISLRGLHGDALRKAIRQGILSKPPAHHLQQRPSDTPRRMHEIGG